MSNNTQKTAIERIAQRAKDAEKRQKELKSHLSPKKHKQLDFFIADMFDTVSFRDDIASMEHPIFALKAGDKKDRSYKHGNISVEVKPTSMGIATIHDKDVWIYCISKLMQAMYEGEEISRTVRFTAYDFLVTTNRGVSGVYYQNLRDSLERLSGTRITTSIKTNDIVTEKGFGLIDNWEIIKEDSTGKVISLEVTLPDWLYRSITSKSVLTISSDYFRLRKPLDRRIYEIARKHCGKQSEFKITLNLLYRKTGSTTPIRNFRIAIKSLSESNELPDYFIQFNGVQDMITFKNRNAKAHIKDLFDGNY